MERLTETKEEDGRRYVRVKGCSMWYDADPRKYKKSDGAGNIARLLKLAEYEEAEERGELVHPVYCRDCIYGEGQWNESVRCRLNSEEPDQISTGYDCFMPMDAYCSYGEKRRLTHETANLPTEGCGA